MLGGQTFVAQLRLFIAADINYAQRTAVERLVSDLKKGVQFTKAQLAWVNPRGMHVTLKFLGGVDDSRVGLIIKTLAPAIESVAPFPFSLGGVGVFPDDRQPRVLWVGVKTGQKEFSDLATAIERGLIPLGIEPERRSFNAHLTLARIKSTRGAREMIDIVESHRDCRLGLAPVDTITLYESRLAPEGATYRVLHRWSLQASGSR